MKKKFIFPYNLRIRYQEIKDIENEALKTKSNDLLVKAIYHYEKILEEPSMPDNFYLIIAEKCLRQLKSIGYFGYAIIFHQKIIRRFPFNPEFLNQLAITYLTINRQNEAKYLLEDILNKWPNNSFAQAHYGLILKTENNNLTEAVTYLKSGMHSTEHDINRGIIYFHLGDALTKLGRNNEAYELYEKGEKEHIFLSKYQRSLYNVKRLRSKPFWTIEDTNFTSFFETLKNKWKIIRDEGLSLINEVDYYQNENENLKDHGDWKQLELFSRGTENKENCLKCPITCEIVKSIPDATNCKRGQIKFSIIQPGTHIWPHCGPTNCRLRSHLGLQVPSNTFIRVVNETRSWKDGEILIFDDSFEHEIWHNGTGIRLILIVDFWHPELTNEEKSALPHI